MDGLEKAQRDHQHRLTSIDHRYRVRVDAAQREVDRLKGQWDDIQTAEDRLPRYSHPFFYWLVMAILAACESPLNRLSFELFFSDSPLWAFCVALLCGVVLIGLAHFFGEGLCRFRYNVKRQRTDSGKRNSGFGVVFMLLLQAALIFALCYGIAILRQGYLSYSLRQDPSFNQYLEQDQYVQAAAFALRASLQVDGLVFLVINLGVVGIGVLAAIFCHDPHPDFEKVDRDLKAARKDLAFHERTYAEALAKEERRFGAEEISAMDGGWASRFPRLPDLSR
ncbi:MAG TPA: hypothetical protein VG943_08570 [Caulobacterales bacterium]|nr:hypothetical protein [Caulobacterales bacterium]